MAVQHKIEREAPGYARWVLPELMHLTLVFLGNQYPQRGGNILAGVREAAAAAEPFELVLGRPGWFGSAPQPRVLWMDVVDREARLQRLHRALVTALGARQIAFDPRPLAPHITLGRAQRAPPRGLGQRASGTLASIDLRTHQPRPLNVSGVSLMCSQPSPNGPRYTERERVELAGQVRGHFLS